jgi:hypothetical protein
MRSNRPEPSSDDHTRQKSALELILDFLSPVIKDRQQRRELSSLIRSVGIWATFPVIALIALVAIFAGSFHITTRAVPTLQAALATFGTTAVIATGILVRRGWNRRVGKNLNGRSADDDARTHGNSDQERR